MKLNILNCPRCGGVIAFEPGQTIQTCRFCHGKSFLAGEKEVSAYYIKHRVTQGDVKDVLKTRVRNMKNVAKGFENAVEKASVHLYFVPYYEISGVRIGTRRQKTLPQKRFQRSPLMMDSYSTGKDLSQLINILVSKEDKQEAEAEQTTVSISDVVWSDPAVQLPEWGLMYFDLQKKRHSDRTLQLEPLDIHNMQNSGTVLDPSLSFEALKSRLISSRKSDDRSSNLLFVDLKIIFFPVYRVTVEFNGLPFNIFMDGTDSKILKAGFPETSSRRYLMFLLYSGLLGGMTGAGSAWLLQLSIILWKKNELELMLLPGVYGLFLFFALGGLLLKSAWNHLRYRGEIRIDGPYTNIVRIGQEKKKYFQRTVHEKQAVP